MRAMVVSTLGLMKMSTEARPYSSEAIPTPMAARPPQRINDESFNISNPPSEYAGFCAYDNAVSDPERKPDRGVLVSNILKSLLNQDFFIVR
jgi:hypothetical protein